MKTHKLTILTAGVGIFIIISSTIRWFFLYPDMSQFVLAVSIGSIILGFAYIYQWMKEVDKFHSEMDKRMDSLVSWWTKQGIKKEFE